MPDPEISRFPLRLIQQALLQVLQGQWDPTFSEHSYGFARSVRTCQGLRPRRVWRALRNDAPASVAAFRGVNNVGTRVYNAFAAQWLAYTLPYRRFAVILAEDCARIGGDVGCYSFIAVDSHHILLAGLPAHSRS